MYRYKSFFIPDYMESALLNYLNYGIEPGSFLTAILSDKLVHAIQKADGTNINNIPAYVSYMMWEMPSSAWGSPEAVSAWIDSGGLKGKGQPLVASITPLTGEDE